jgi:hypothetical protein
MCLYSVSYLFLIWYQGAKFVRGSLPTCYSPNSAPAHSGTLSFSVHLLSCLWFDPCLLEKLGGLMELLHKFTRKALGLLLMVIILNIWMQEFNSDADRLANEAVALAETKFASSFAS